MGMRHAKTLGLALSAWILGGLGIAAMAQINPFWSSRFGPRLTNRDVQELISATDRLNANSEARAGETVSWSNSANKAHGTVGITRVFESRGWTCHAIRYRTTLAARPPRALDLNWCKTPDGWKVVS